MGARSAHPARPLAPVTPANPQQRRGGQHSLGCFGYASFTGSQATAQPTRKADDQPARIAGLTCGQRRALIQARVNAAPAKAAMVDLHAATVQIVPRRKVPASPIKGALNYFDRDGLEKVDNAALDRRERQEIEAEEARARAVKTAAMEHAAREAQLREEREWRAAGLAEEAASYADFMEYWFPYSNAIMAREGGL